MPGKPTTRRYSDQEKAQAVRLVRQLRAEVGSDYGTVKRVAGQLGYGIESVRSWVRQADIDEGVTAGTTTADAERLKRLEQEVRELRRAERDGGLNRWPQRVLRTSPMVSDSRGSCADVR